MATFVVCTRCGKVEEITGIDLLPNTWQRTLSALLCPRCTMIAAHGAAKPLPDEERYYPERRDEFDEDFVEDEEDCSVCGGPCQGH